MTDGRRPDSEVSGTLARDDLSAAVTKYWNERIHDLEMTTQPVGSPEFFQELDEYRFEKLEYLPRVVDFNGFAGKRLLEIGCGVGTDLVRFARGGAHVTGVDVSETAVNIAGQNLAVLGLSGDVRVADAANLDFETGTFDLVYCHGVLQYAVDPTTIVREAFRVLAPKGQAIFMVYNRRSWLAWMSRRFKVKLEHEDAPVLRLYTTQEFEEMLSIFPRRTIIPERFPVRSRIHGGLKGILFNHLFVPAFTVLPRGWVRGFGWHLMAFCTKA